MSKFKRYFIKLLLICRFGGYCRGNQKAKFETIFQMVKIHIYDRIVNRCRLLLVHGHRLEQFFLSVLRHSPK